MKKIYIIAEIGQNHNGDINLAKKLIDMASTPIKDVSFNKTLTPINAVKFTKRDLSEELTDDANSKHYESIHSYGKTYGLHRKKLELS